jgi:hypothetical protein
VRTKVAAGLAGVLLVLALVAVVTPVNTSKGPGDHACGSVLSPKTVPRGPARSGCDDKRDTAQGVAIGLALFALAIGIATAVRSRSRDEDGTPAN